MKIFFDTSALAKRYVEEPGSDQIEYLFLSLATKVFVCTLAFPEFATALGRKVRDNEIPKKAATHAVEEFEKDWEGLYIKIPVSDNLAESAASLAIQYPLKGADAVHLASAVSTSPDLFVVADHQLIAAAEKLDLTSYDPTSGPIRIKKL